MVGVEKSARVALSKRWAGAGVETGDVVLVHSSIKRTLAEFRHAGVAVDAGDILQSFLDVVGARGTLLLPLFNFDFTSGVPFDIRRTPSRMGALAEAGRVHAEAVRTGHPIYSFAVIGYRSNEFENIDNESGYSEESPFGLLKRMDGKIAALDRDDQGCMTFYHHVEEVKKVDYRLFKTFAAPYTDWNGVTESKSYKLYVRDLERGVQTHVNPAGELLWEKGLYKGDRPLVGSGLRVVRSKAMFDLVGQIIDQGKALGMLYSLEKLP
ncbi:AAC(3) family N-acetyltransferase [Haematospirillum sp. H1815]|uniref:AAC(3) family N-acetyltransferase n=1 Tax=Haematospirillum sp. H1815 TaxID=2723108 RepID=UPI00143958EF|nr:AAC(3) family N-acetyltransferase [Haematospirillum sp. H1815]NKD76179.1 AAC(3) family N-acetyltransferase [Haematospirillum sp. H1815]